MPLIPVPSFPGPAVRPTGVTERAELSPWPQFTGGGFDFIEPSGSTHAAVS